MPISARKLRSQQSSRPVSLAATNSASVVESATMDWSRDAQLTAPPATVRSVPVVERPLSRFPPWSASEKARKRKGDEEAAEAEYSIR